MTFLGKLCADACVGSDDDTSEIKMRERLVNVGGNACGKPAYPSIHPVLVCLKSVISGGFH